MVSAVEDVGRDHHRFFIVSFSGNVSEEICSANSRIHMHEQGAAS